MPKKEIKKYQDMQPSGIVRIGQTKKHKKHFKGGSAMNIENRAEEIYKSIKSASKETYRKAEILPELFALQQEIVDLTFNLDHADLGNLKIWDVENHLEQLNESLGGIATEELLRFKSGSRCLSNHIKAECSGNKGESKAFYALDRMQTEHMILKNVELTDCDNRTEIDAVVITQKGAFIIEVKNTHRNAFIDENGDYYRTGEYMKWDSNIVYKMKTKREFLSNALSNAGIEIINIFEIVVFTNNHIEVRNRCDRIKTCFLSQLPYIIDEWQTDDDCVCNDLHQVSDAIEKARCEEAYPLDFDTDRYKKDFAALMAKLEAASQTEEENPVPNKSSSEKGTRFIDCLKKFFSRKKLKVAGGAAAVTISVLAAFGLGRKFK